MMSADDLRGLVQDFKTREAAEARQREEAAQESRQQAAEEAATQHLEPARLRALVDSMRDAAKRGQAEIMALRIPSDSCSDGGRAVDVNEDGWPDTLRGPAADLYRFWSDELRPQGIKLRATVLDWPNGMIGDIGLFLAWS